jgi:hypothetical protein
MSVQEISQRFVLAIGRRELINMNVSNIVIVSLQCEYELFVGTKEPNLLC